MNSSDYLATIMSYLIDTYRAEVFVKTGYLSVESTKIEAALTLQFPETHFVAQFEVPEILEMIKDVGISETIELIESEIDNKFNKYYTKW